ncbi:MAG: DeoR family transcriptional regulator [Candidatus Nealsonbacteria bacterium]
MNKELLIKLTNRLYRITLFFPKKEPLRYKMRELATDFLAGQNKKDLEILDSFFDVALTQNWVSLAELLEIKSDYANFKDGLDATENKPQFALQKEVIGLEPDNQGLIEKLPERHTKILDFLKKNGRAQVWQLKQVLPEVTKRTLRRDFDSLLTKGIIKRLGERNNTFYQLENLSI